MKLSLSLVLVIYVGMFLHPLGSYGQKRPAVPEDRFTVSHYDPKRNASDDLKAAVTEAQRTGKRILLQVGGDWCVWCHRMDAFYQDHPELLALRKRNYILIKINFSLDNRNEEFLSHYPKIEAAPHILILDQNGNLVRSEDTGELELGKSYDLNKFLAFLKQFSPSAH